MLKKLYIIGVLLSLFSIGKVSAQIIEEKLPLSFQSQLKSSPIIPSFSTDSIDYAKLQAEDLQTGITNRYAKVQPVSIDIKRDGVATKIPNEGTIWRYRITSPLTFSLGLFFSHFIIPEGGELYLYNDSKTIVRGAYTAINNNNFEQLAFADFEDDNITIEYFEPSNVNFSGDIIIGRISQAYKNISNQQVTRINVNCELGENWQRERNAVCKITYTSGLYQYTCTGALVNNTNNDGTPYFLTANHCIGTEKEANSAVIYFNYQNTTCTSNDALFNMRTLSGATLKANGSDSDFALLLLNQKPLKSYQPYMAGWDCSGRKAPNSTTIHHPDGEPKCILSDASAIANINATITWDEGESTPPNSHWAVTFDQANTEGGSSGAPLFDDKHRVIGQLHGGDASESDYGKFSYSWSTASEPTKQLANWLDPQLSGTKTLEGKFLYDIVDTDFTTEIYTICSQVPVQFTDISKNSPTSWAWTIEPETFELLNNTTLSSQNPVVIFNAYDDYTITLKAQNSVGGSTMMKRFVVTDQIDFTISGATADKNYEATQLSNNLFILDGAMEYEITNPRPDLLQYTLQNDTLIFSLTDRIPKSDDFYVRMEIKGKSGSCEKSKYLLLEISNSFSFDADVYSSNNQATLNITSAFSTNCRIKFYNATGALVLEDEQLLSPQLNQLTYSLSGFRSGIYMVVLETDNDREEIKFVHF